MSQQSQMQLHKKNKNYRQAYVEFQLTQHEFSSQRQQTNHSFEVYGSSTMRPSRQFYPATATSIQFHINNPITEIIRQFKRMLREKGFKCIQIFPNQLYLARLRFLDKIKKLFACVEPPKYILSIRTHEYRSVRTVSLKQLHSVKESEYNSSQIDQILVYLFSSPKLNKPLTNQQISQLDNQYRQDFYSLDATSNYMFSKMLVDANYSIGKRINTIINRFKQKKRVQENKFSDLIWLNYAITEITDEMLQGFNCSRKQLYEILGYCRKSIQNYFYSSVEQWRAEIITHQSLDPNVPQKDEPLTKAFTPQKFQDSPSSRRQKFNQEYFQQLYPISLKHLNLLLNTNISIQIFERLYVFIQFIKIQTQNNKISQEINNLFLEWIKNQYNQRILLKFKVIKAAGFMDKFTEQFIRDLRLQI